MNEFLLDTNISSELIKPSPEPRVARWLYAQSENSLFLSAITIGEMRKGILLLPSGKRKETIERWLEEDLIAKFTGRILPVTQMVADRWGALSASRQLAGVPLGVADGLIAATAFENNLTLVTRNVKDFIGLGTILFNPWELTV